ncbi:Ger(x)C family spore germination protein [Lysinibacillus fusiformis]|jgi:Ger(x)C family germination protein|uniref:Ger(x)C family spore germination protein n=1 Tax=Lysinibacillus TaxID=400634 RepID=UPI0004D89163|nr:MULTISPECIES: Ger(x)C family spore germination protein [Lysinibacillus]KAB0442338.1 Ger(x)C family spore germination protein [Lysinibacillus fusiformis]KEK10776.1 spore gernimation protein [Lysinibacillus sphaericus]MCK1987735.1 Ger(x)C family spore germination protein [Lysinibacillus fusiformis]MCT6817468.1 Ger(x)C family spore germination protein [Lysinibacillus fusiformis]MCT6927779.1 Ger(x)C family spore germination protein [Lysinibacillus fusiformis]
MSQKNIMLVILMLTTTLLMSGCWDVTEPQRMYYVQGVGVDYKDNEYIAYIQLMNFANVAKTEQSNPQAAPTEVGKATGKTIEEAIYKLYRSMDQEVFWGHMTFLLFSEKAMESEHAIPIIDTFLRFRETRYHIWVYCTQDPIEEVLLVSPILEKSPTATKLSNPKNTSKQESFVEPVNLRQLVIGLNEPNHEMKVPFISINQDWETAKESRTETVFAGVGILSKNTFKGFIKGNTARGIEWMNDATKQGEITVKLDNTEERDYLTVDIKKLDVNVKPIVQNNQVKFEVYLKFNTILNGFKGKVTASQVRKKVESEVKKEIMATFEAGLNIDADVYRLSEYLYRDNVKVWKKIQKDGKIPLTKESISKIDIHINKVSPGRKSFEETITE